MYNISKKEKIIIIAFDCDIIYIITKVQEI